MATYDKNELALIWLDSFEGLEYHKKQVLYGKIKGRTEIKRIITENADYLITAIGDKGYANILNSANAEYFDYVMSGLNKAGVTAVTIESKDYPESLRNTDLPPLVLYVKGDISLLKEKCFAVVGSRKSLPRSIKIAEMYAEGLIDSGFTLVTGIAEGIDESVLKTAIKRKAKVISVIAGGITNVYPKSNFDLCQEVAKVGLVISEHRPEINPKPYFFPIRNRIIAGLSKGVLVVSGAKKSGTLYTAEYALEYGRDVFAIPYDMGIESGQGCNDLIKRGANLTDTFEDIENFYGIKKAEKTVELTEEEKKVIELLKTGAKHVEKISQELNKQVYEIIPFLSVMEIKGFIVRSGVNSYSLISTNLEE